MNNEELQQEVKRLEQQITELRLKILESKADKKPYEVEVPEDLEDYYYVDELGKVHSIGEKLNYYDFEKAYLRGLAFKTKEEAEQFDKERILIKKLKDWAKKYNDGWTPSWNETSEAKYCVEYNNYPEEFIVDYYSGIVTFSKLPYFKSREIAEQFMKEFGEEIKEVLY